MSAFAWIGFVMAALAAPGGQLAFVSGATPDDLRVQVMALDTGETAPAGPGRRDGAPRWSPDGQWLAFETCPGEGMGIYVVRADGSEGRVVSAISPWNRMPHWAADGKRLAYTADNDEDMKTRIVVCDLDTGTETAWGGDTAPPMLRPVWLPSIVMMKALDPEEKLNKAGEELTALANEASESGVLMAMAFLPGEGKMRLCTEPMLVTRSRCAPLLPLLLDDSVRYAEWGMESDRKGEHIVYESTDGGDREIYALGKRGLINESNHFAADWNPVWAPDAKRIAFESFRGGRRGVYTVFYDTAKVSPVDVSPEYDTWAPAWSPDSEWVAYVSMRTGDPELFVSRFDGTDVKQLTHHPGPDYAPAWRPTTDKKK